MGAGFGGTCKVSRLTRKRLRNETVRRVSQGRENAVTRFPRHCDFTGFGLLISDLPFRYDEACEPKSYRRPGGCLRRRLALLGPAARRYRSRLCPRRKIHELQHQRPHGPFQCASQLAAGRAHVVSRHHRRGQRVHPGGSRPRHARAGLRPRQGRRRALPSSRQYYDAAHLPFRIDRSFARFAIHLRHRRFQSLEVRPSGQRL